MANGTPQSGSGSNPGGYGHVDPNGLQTASTASSALGFVALVGSGTAPTMASALGLGTHMGKFLTAGISLASLGHLNLFSSGLMLVGLGIVLNIASLAIRWQYRRKDPNG